MLSLSLRRAIRSCAAPSWAPHVSSLSSPFASRHLSSTSVSMPLLKELRSKSGAPMVECKKALEQSQNDMNDAMDWLRQHGVAKASSKSRGRDASEGLVGVRVSKDGTVAALVKVSSETDFAGRSEAFVNLVTHVADATMESSGIVGMVGDEEIFVCSFDGKTVRQVLDEAVLAIRENLGIASAVRLEASEGGVCVGYVHGRVDFSSVAGTAAAIVHVAPKEGMQVAQDVLREAGKKLAMHVVAAKPQYLNPEAVPESVLEKERDILKQQLADSGKPDNILDKIITGRLRKFYEGVCLTEQAHMVEEGNPSVSKVLDGLGVHLVEFEAQSVS